MESMKNFSNATSFDANVAEGMANKKTKGLADLYVQTGVAINEAFPIKKTSTRSQGNFGKVMLIE